MKSNRTYSVFHIVTCWRWGMVVISFFPYAGVKSHFGAQLYALSPSLSVLPDSANAFKAKVSFDALLTSKGFCLQSVLAAEHPY